MQVQLYKNIVSNPEVCGGRPTIKGTRITVRTVIEQVLAGGTDEVVLECFPRLTKESLKNCKDFAPMLFENASLINSFKYNEDESLKIPGTKIIYLH
ncbi:MAG: DUF433 domain-containing protein [Ginsengibacter sp.]